VRVALDRYLARGERGEVQPSLAEMVTICVLTPYSTRCSLRRDDSGLMRR